MAKKRKLATRELTEADIEAIEAVLPQLLEWPLALPLSRGVGFERTHDDHQGSFEGKIQLSISHDGDVWLATDKHGGPMLRFRTPGFVGGGGRSPRVWNALRLLAYAIVLDNRDYPESPH